MAESSEAPAVAALPKTEVPAPTEVADATAAEPAENTEQHVEVEVDDQIHDADSAFEEAA